MSIISTIPPQLTECIKPVHFLYICFIYIPDFMFTSHEAKVIQKHEAFLPAHDYSWSFSYKAAQNALQNCVFQDFPSVKW